MKHLLEYEEFSALNEGSVMDTIKEVGKFLAIYFGIPIGVFALLIGSTIIYILLKGRKSLAGLKQLYNKHFTKDEIKIIADMIKNAPEMKKLETESTYLTNRISKICETEGLDSSEKYEIALTHNKELKKLSQELDKNNDVFFKTAMRILPKDLAVKFKAFKSDLYKMEASDVIDVKGSARLKFNG